MKKSELIGLVKEIIKEVQALREVNATNAGGASFTPGAGAQYATPKAFGKDNRAVKALKKIGYKEVSRPKRPSHTKAFDYL
tara:strand:- start:48 stop:290 length:243 start_codon:yes stop_codon:yes gene_type:complete